MFSQLICENKDFLRSLALTKSERRNRKILRKADTSQLLSIVEICLNIVKSRFNLNTRQKNRLLPHVEFIRKMSRARSERGVRKVLRQKGGGVGVFAALLTPVLIELARAISIKAYQNNSNQI